MKIGRSADVNEILKINPKFEQIIPPLTADEFAQLEENILKVGRVIEPIGSLQERKPRQKAVVHLYLPWSCR